MAYSKTNWQDLPSTTTPLNATNLNKIENELSDLDNKIDKKINILENGTYQNYIVCLAETHWSGIVPLPNADEYNITINSLSINQVQYSVKEVINVTKTGFQCLLTSKVATTDYGIINYTIVHK